jgi:hypothetical protein
MMTASLRILPLLFAPSLGFTAAIAAAGIGPAHAAAHSPMLGSESGRPAELVNRPGCSNDGDYETRPACAAARR